MVRYIPKKQYFWTADLAYIVGLMASDGCLLKDTRHLNITSKDIEIIDIFRSVLKIRGKRQIKKGGYGTLAFQLQFSDVTLYDFLLEVGLTPAKSLTLDKLNIPDEWYADFLRGHFDGDGTVYGYRDSRWRNSHMFYTEFISASLPFLKWIHETNRRLFVVQHGTILKVSRAYRLSYAKADSKVLFQEMYSKPTCSKLSRKYNKFVAFLSADPYAVKE